MTSQTTRRLAAEGVGTALLLVAIVGSGIMGERLAAGNTAIALLANSLATGCALAVLILAFAPISGAHFNPAVTLIDALRRDMPPGLAIAYVVVQVAAAFAGVAMADLMFGEPLFSASTKIRTGLPQWLGETIATFGLMVAILGTRERPSAAPFAVALYITGAYWFTSSTSFANPAATLARAVTNTFAGIRPDDMPAFIASQLTGALAGMVFMRWLRRL